MAKSDVKLMFVSGANNNNKFYNLHDNDNGTFTVHYGRVGASGTYKDYNISDWDKLLASKLKKGYTDVTNTKLKAKTNYIDEGDPDIQAILSHLLTISKQYVDKITDTTYLSPMAIRDVQNDINELIDIKSLKCGEANYLEYLKRGKLVDNLDNQRAYSKNVVAKFNGVLEDIMKIIPRTTSDVKIYQLKADFNITTNASNKAIDMIITREQSLLDNLSMQSSVAPTGTQTISQAFGFNLCKASPTERDFIIDKFKKDCGGETFHAKIVNVYKVNNPKREADFEEYLDTNGLENSDKNVRLYWHGTGSENLLSILSNGLLIKPSNVSYSGSAFGKGIYNAPSPIKANSYAKTDSERGSIFMLVNAVITGNPFSVNNNSDRLGVIRIMDLNGDVFSQLNLGYHSVHAHASSTSYIRRDEVIVYNQSQVATRYLIELK